MSIEDYRKVVNERIADIIKAKKALTHLGHNYYSTFINHALENLRLAEIELHKDWLAHEEVDRAKESEAKE